MITKPAVASHKVTIDSNSETEKLIASSARELVSVVVTAGGFAMAVRIYDASSADTIDPKNSLLIAANAGESTPYCPAQSIPFKKGIYVVIEQGAAGGGEVFLTLN